MLHAPSQSVFSRSVQSLCENGQFEKWKQKKNKYAPHTHTHTPTGVYTNVCREKSFDEKKCETLKTNKSKYQVREKKQILLTRRRDTRSL